MAVAFMNELTLVSCVVSKLPELPSSLTLDLLDALLKSAAAASSRLLFSPSGPQIPLVP